jgi:ornithine cyclodeaminase (EC 4.3.1.12)
MDRPIFLSADDLADLAGMSAYVDAVAAAYRERADAAPTEPRTRLDASDPPGFFTTYAAILPETGAMGGYMYSAGFGDRDTWFVCPLFDTDSGRLLAILDGSYMNPHKTGAVGAVGIDALARPDATEVAIIGSGAQARGQLRGAAAVRDVDAVRVYSPTPASREAFAEAMHAELGLPIDPVSSSAAALEGADIVITATTAGDPVFASSELDPGTHITAMGQYTPGRTELDTETVRRARYVPDLRARALQDAGSFLAARDAGLVDDDHIVAELGEVLADPRLGRTDDAEITIFDSGGTAVETVGAAAMLYERAVERDLGTPLDIRPGSETFS